MSAATMPSPCCKQCEASQQVDCPVCAAPIGRPCTTPPLTHPSLHPRPAAMTHLARRILRGQTAATTQPAPPTPPASP